MTKEKSNFAEREEEILKFWQKEKIFEKSLAKDSPKGDYVFYDDKKLILNDILHSGKEPRFILLGKTKANRLLFTIFTIRNNKIRIISSRDVNKKEKKLYE